MYVNLKDHAKCYSAFTVRTLRDRYDKYVKYFSMYTWGAGQLSQEEK